MGRTAKDTIRTVIERGEGGDMTVTANQDKIGGEKVGRQSGGRLTSRGSIVAGRSGSESRHAVAEIIKKGRGENVGGVGGGRGSGKELTRKNERRAVNGLSIGGGVHNVSLYSGLCTSVLTVLSVLVIDKHFFSGASPL